MRTRDIDVLQIIYNMLEQDPGRSMLATAEERGVSVLTRVPHSSGLLEGKYTAETTFSEKDHRSHRPKEWLIEGLQKLEKLAVPDGRYRPHDRPGGDPVAALAPEHRLRAAEHLRRSEQLREFADGRRRRAADDRGDRARQRAASTRTTECAAKEAQPRVSGPPSGHGAPVEGGRRQVVKFSFYRVDPAWRALAAGGTRARQGRVRAGRRRVRRQAAGARLLRDRDARRRGLPALADRRAAGRHPEPARLPS